MTIEGIRIEGSFGRGGDVRVRTMERIDLSVSVYNDRGCDIARPNVQIAWEAEGA